MTIPLIVSNSITVDSVHLLDVRLVDKERDIGVAPQVERSLLW